MGVALVHVNRQNDKHLKLTVAFRNDFAKAPKRARYTSSFRSLDLKEYCDQTTGRCRNQGISILESFMICVFVTPWGRLLLEKPVTPQLVKN